MTYEQDAAAVGAKADAAIADKEAANGALSTQVVVLKDQVVALNAEIADLEAQLAALRPTVALGAWAELNADGKSTLAEQAQFDTLSGATMAATMQYAPYKNADGTAVKFLMAKDIYAAGRWPHYAWGAGGPSIPDIAAGKADAHLTQTAKNIAAIQTGRFQFRPWWEMNGRWFAWCADKYGNDTTQYVKAWRRMADIFRANAPDVELVWSPAWQSLPNEAWNKMANYYPGDEYVDRIGIEPYNKYGTADSNTWRSFETLVAETMTLAAGKPVMMTEGACLEDVANPARKAQWITDMGGYVKAHPEWKELLWFHRPPTSAEPKDFRVDTTPQSLAAWRALCADPYFRTQALSVNAVTKL